MVGVRCWASIAVWAAGFLSCSVPRAYQSPRTTPTGKLSHSLAVDLGQGFFEQADREEDTLLAPEGQNLATYTMRAGLAERWDAGFSFGTLLLASEVKWNFLQSPSVDAAIAPRAQYFEPLSFAESTRKVVTLSLPVPVALNLNREVSLIVAPTLAYAAGQRPASDPELEPPEPAVFERSLIAGTALDLQLRAHSRLTLQPGVTAYRRLDDGAMRWQLGIGISWGAMPFYGDVPP